MEPTIFTLKQVVQSIKKTIETRYHDSYWVKAEVYKLNVFPSGHAFPELVQKENGQLVAQITGIIWKANFDRIRQQFEKTVKEPLGEGKEYLIQVKINYSPLYGLSLQILDIDPNFSLGALHQIRIETLKKLNDQGIISSNQKLNFVLPKRIALISAESSKGLSDFYSVLNANPRRFGIDTFLFNSLVQGDQAILSITSALSKIERLSHLFDVVVIVRGGGSEVGMSCYDEFPLCQKIATFPLPVLTGIGHSTNLTVAEMVSYSHAITPTKLAQDIISFFEVEEQNTKKLKQQFIHLSKALFLKEKSNYNLVLRAIPNVINWRLEKQKSNMALIKQNLNHHAIQLSAKEGHNLNAWAQKIPGRVRHIQDWVASELNQNQKTLMSATAQTLFRLESQLQPLVKNVSILDPKNILARGYAIARFQNKVVFDINTLKSGDILDLEFHGGHLKSEIKKDKS